MKLTPDQIAERESVKRFMLSVASDRSFRFDLNSHVQLHHASFCGPSGGVESEISRVVMEAFSRGDVETLANIQHIAVINAMSFGFILGREYEKRMQLERMFGDEEQPAKPKRTRAASKRKVD